MLEELGNVNCGLSQVKTKQNKKTLKRFVKPAIGNRLQPMVRLCRFSRENVCV